MEPNGPMDSTIWVGEHGTAGDFSSNKARAAARKIRDILLSSCKTPGASDREGHRSRWGVISSLRTSI